METVVNYVPADILSEILKGLGTVIGFLVLYLVTQLIAWMKTKLTVARADQLSAAIDKLVMFGVTQVEDLIRNRGPEGWRDPAVKEAVKESAIINANFKFPDALSQAGIDLRNSTDRAKFAEAIDRAIPGVFAVAAASPATPPAPETPAIVVAAEVKA